MKIKLSKVKNIRDFSEYGYKDFIRSSHLNKLSEKDVSVLINEHNLKTVIDLRTAKEAEEKPDVEMPGVTYIHIPIFTDAIPGISHEEETDKSKNMLPDMCKLYSSLVTEEPYVSQIKKVIDVIFDPERDGAVLWHCTEGKDRCGIISALFLLSKGISKEEVIKEYLLTNKVNSSKSRRYYFLMLLLGRGFEFAGKVRDAFVARREYIEPVLDDIINILDEKSLSGEATK